jgi:peptide deformylase
MAKLAIIKLPDPILRKVSAPVERVDNGCAGRRHAGNHVRGGVGLAAVQVGVPRRLIVLDMAKGEDDRRARCPLQSGNHRAGIGLREHEECLSIPGVRIVIERPSSATFRFLDREGKPQELAAKGLLATVIQHEIDHLNGRLIIDFLSRLKRDIIVRRFKKLAKETA